MNFLVVDHRLEAVKHSHSRRCTVAHVTDAARVRIDALLARVLSERGDLPRVEAEIDQWNLIEQIVFIEEWPIQEDVLTDLERYAEARALTPEQRARYAGLQRLVAQNRPIICRLQQS